MVKVVAVVGLLLLPVMKGVIFVPSFRNIHGIQLVRGVDAVLLAQNYVDFSSSSCRDHDNSYPKSFCRSMVLRGGGRLPFSERSFRKKQASEQVKAGIGKSLWRRKSSGVTAKSKQAESLAAIKNNIFALESSVRDRETKTFTDAENNDPSGPVNTEQSIENLNALEKQARDLLQTIQKEKGAVVKREHRSKKSRRKLQRVQGRIDHHSNWKSMM